jgi:hypothetical protein
MCDHLSDLMFVENMKKTHCSADCVCPELRERESKAPEVGRSFSLHPPRWPTDVDYHQDKYCIFISNS